MSVPYVPQKTKSRFYRPPTLQDDFDTFLNNDLPHSVLDFELIKDWYASLEDDYEHVIIRGEMYPESTKSRYENTDNTMNFRASVDSGIRKGDIVIASDDGDIYVLDWEVSLQANNAPSRLLRCNNAFTFYRYIGNTEVVDPDTGMVIEPEADRYITLAENMPCNAYRYDGRPEFSANAGTPGIAPKALTYVTTQYNEKTKNIRIDDKFTWEDETYTIVDVNRFSLHYVHTDEEGNPVYHGTLKFQCQKEAGGLNYD